MSNPFLHYILSTLLYNRSIQIYKKELKIRTGFKKRNIENIGKIPIRDILQTNKQLPTREFVIRRVCIYYSQNYSLEFCRFSYSHLELALRWHFMTVKGQHCKSYYIPKYSSNPDEFGLHLEIGNNYVILFFALYLIDLTL